MNSFPLLQIQGFYEEAAGHFSVGIFTCYIKLYSMLVINGNGHPYAETGTEGIYWAVVDSDPSKVGYDSLLVPARRSYASRFKGMYGDADAYVRNERDSWL